MDILPPCMSGHHRHIVAYRGQKRVPNLLKLDLQMVRATSWLLQIEPSPLQGQQVFSSTLAFLFFYLCVYFLFVGIGSPSAQTGPELILILLQVPYDGIITVFHKV